MSGLYKKWIRKTVCVLSCLLANSLANAADRALSSQSVFSLLRASSCEVDRNIEFCVVMRNRAAEDRPKSYESLLGVALRSGELPPLSHFAETVWFETVRAFVHQVFQAQWPKTLEAPSIRVVLHDVDQRSQEPSRWVSELLAPGVMRNTLVISLPQQGAQFKSTPEVAISLLQRELEIFVQALARVSRVSVPASQVTLALCVQQRMLKGQWVEWDYDSHQSADQKNLHFSTELPVKQAPDEVLKNCVHPFFKTADSELADELVDGSLDESEAQPSLITDAEGEIDDPEAALDVLQKLGRLCRLVGPSGAAPTAMSLAYSHMVSVRDIYLKYGLDIRPSGKVFRRSEQTKAQEWREVMVESRGQPNTSFSALQAEIETLNGFDSSVAMNAFEAAARLLSDEGFTSLLNSHPGGRVCDGEDCVSFEEALSAYCETE